MKKFKNYGLWVAIASLVFLIQGDLGLDISEVKFMKYQDLIFGILVLLGIISSPEKGKGFKMKEGKEKTK